MGYAIYCRISRDTNGEGAGVSRQENECRQFAEQHNLDVSEVYTDNDISAFSGATRPAYEDMLQAVRDGHLQGIICWHVDRLYRRTRDLEEIVDLVEKTNIEVRTVKAGDLDLNSATGRMMARMVATIANYEVDHMTERQLSSQTSRAVEGKYRGGRPPYGYDLGPTTGTLQINEDEAKVLRMLSREVLAGTGLLTLSKRLNEQGIPTKTGKRWRTSTIRRALDNPSIAGITSHHGKEVGKAQWPAILPEDEWRAVGAILADPSRRTQRGNVKKWQGAGLYRCGKCGGKMVTSQARRKTGSGRMYQCGQCWGVGRNLDNVDNLINSIIIGYLDKPENRLTILERSSSEGADVAELVTKRGMLIDRRSRLGALYADGTIDEAQLTSGTTEITRQVEALDRKITAAQQTSPSLQLVLGAEDVAEAWEQCSAERRGEIIDELMIVTILPAGKPGRGFDPTKIKIEWK